MTRVYEFLELTEPNAEQWDHVLKANRRNSLGDRTKQRLEPMQEKTRQVLNDFYEPFNVLLKEQLQDDIWLWHADPESITCEIM